MNRIREFFELEKIKQTGRNIRIAILDTGIFLHRDIENSVIFYKDFISDTNNPTDENGHGTHIAGIISGSGLACNHKYMGIATEADLLMLKVLDKNGNGKTIDFIRALKWVLENKEKFNIKLLNFSVGFIGRSNLYDRKMFLDLINKIWDAGITVVTAAGNNGPKSNTITVPGISRKVITVGALNENFSGCGPTECCIIKPEILAPGSNITSLKNKKDEYISKTGTSMATPIVCAALALALEKNNELRPIDLKLALYNTVDDMPDDTICWGKLNICKLINYI